MSNQIGPIGHRRLILKPRDAENFLAHILLFENQISLGNGSWYMCFFSLKMFSVNHPILGGI